MSRFFRTDDSTSSESDSDSSSDHETTRKTKIEGPLELSATNAESTTLSSPDWTNYHRDFLLHALLEERCMNEVRIMACA